MYRKKTLMTLLIIIDIVLISYWIFSIRPDESTSLVLIYILPIVGFVNLVIGIVLKILKIKYDNLFLINIPISMTITFLIFLLAIRYYKENNLKHKYFNYNDNTYNLYFYNTSREFEITAENGNIISGSFSKIEGDTIFLITKKYKNVYIINDELFNFPKQNSKIKFKD